MSPASYRAAPPRVGCRSTVRTPAGRRANPRPAGHWSASAAGAGATAAAAWSTRGLAHCRVAAHVAALLNALRARFSYAVASCVQRRLQRRRDRPARAPRRRRRWTARCRTAARMRCPTVSASVTVLPWPRVGRRLRRRPAPNDRGRARRSASTRTPTWSPKATSTLLQQRVRRSPAPRDVQRLDVEQPAADRQGQQVAVHDAASRLRVEQRDRLGDLRGRTEPVLDLARSEDRRVARQLEHAASCRSRSGSLDDRDVGGQVVPLSSALSALVSWKSGSSWPGRLGDEVVRRLVPRAARSVGSVGTCQKSCAVVELLRVADVELGEQVPLHLEQVLRVAEVRRQVRPGSRYSGLMMLPPKALFHAFRTGSLSSNSYSVTVPS